MERGCCLAVLVLAAACSPATVYVMPVAASAKTPELLDPLVACAGQRGLNAQHHGDEVRVSFPDNAQVEYKAEDAQHMAMSVRGPGDHVRERGEELFSCAQGMAAQANNIPPQGGPAPAATPGPGNAAATPGPENRGPQCTHLATCYVDLVHALCATDNTHCAHANAFQLRTGMNETACQQTLANLPMAVDPIRRHKPDFQMPATCSVAP